MFPETQPTQQPPIPQPQPEVAQSYLDQISTPKAPRRGLLLKKPVLIGLIFIIVALLAIVISSLPRPTNQTALLAGRLVATKVVTEKSSHTLKSTQLRSINSNLKIYLTNTIRDITPFLADKKINIDKLDGAITTAESTTDLMERLEEARLNAVYDRTYAREMAYKLLTIIALIDQIDRKTSDSELKAFLKSSKTNLTPTQKQFADFNADNS